MWRHQSNFIQAMFQVQIIGTGIPLVVVVSHLVVVVIVIVVCTVAGLQQLRLLLLLLCLLCGLLYTQPFLLLQLLLLKTGLKVKRSRFFRGETYTNTKTSFRHQLLHFYWRNLYLYLTFCINLCNFVIGQSAYNIQIPIKYCHISGYEKYKMFLHQTKSARFRR